MPDYELHADYDRNGRLTGSPSEYDQRGVAPGAIVVANLDADGAAWPKTVDPNRSVTLDVGRELRLGRDNELLPLQVRVVNPTAPADAKFFLQIHGKLADRVRIFDRRGHPFQRDAAGRFPLDLSGAVLELLLECPTLPGSTRSLMLKSKRAQQELTLELIAVDPAGESTTLDEGVVWVAPWIIPSNIEKTLRLYMCKHEDNEPSVEDVTRAVGGLRDLVFVIVPKELAPDDAWLQDQFQHGVVEGPGGWMHVLLHLPRVGANVTLAAGYMPQNLAHFVTSHFPSREVGIYDELWQRTIDYTTVDGKTQRYTFRESYQLWRAMLAVFLLRQLIASARRQIAAIKAKMKAAGQAPSPADLPPIVMGETFSQTRSVLEEEVSDTKVAIFGLPPSDREPVKHFSSRLDEDLRVIRTLFPYETPAQVMLPVPGGGYHAVAPKTADRLLVRLDAVHSSHNAGGNIEASPPVRGAPYGKIFIGHVQGGTMDPDLLNFLRAQGAQPVVEIDTRWLSVGHIDEILTFVPAAGTARFAAVRASPGVGMALLRAAWQRYRHGLPAGDWWIKDRFVPNDTWRETNRGTAPVTMMMRGKAWLHRHPPGAPAGDVPPLIYRKLAAAYTKAPKGPRYNIQYRDGAGPDRRYPAAITIEEFMELERDASGESVNDFIESTFMVPMDKRLGEELPGAAIVRLPVLFDAIDSLTAWKDDKRDAKTCAFTPDMLNMQVVGNRLLIPRPLGPRMRPKDAAGVLQDVLAEMGLGGLAGRATSRWLQKLAVFRVWMNPEPPILLNYPDWALFDGFKRLANLEQIFRDGFPGENEPAIGRKIAAANRGAIRDGLLQSGWHNLVIPEGTVDLFEAYTQLVLEDLGAEVHWIDSWFYHVRFGGIHCGTNTIREPVARAGKKWWHDVAES